MPVTGNPPPARQLTSAEKQRDRILLVAGLLSMWGPIVGGYAAYVGRSVVLVADMLRSGADSAGLMLAWWAHRASRRYAGPDREQRARILDRQIGLLVAGVMWLSASVIMWGAVREFIDPQPVGKILAGVLIAAGGVVYNAYFWWRYIAIARQTGSALFHAQWRLYRAKAAANATVLVALLAGRAFAGYAWSSSIDAAGSVVVAGFLVVSGIATARKALRTWTDDNPPGGGAATK